MNKLRVMDDDISFVSEDGNIKCDVFSATKFLNVKSVKIKVIKDTDLVIESRASSSKIDICVNVMEGVNLNIYEIKRGKDYKFQYKFYLEMNSHLNIEKICDVEDAQEMTLFNLNGEGASVHYNLKTISKSIEKYIFMVYHNANKTVSYINNNGVNIKNGKLEFNVSSFVPNNVKKCDVNQSARIINNTDNTCVIKPNLFIDEEDVTASHSALIGTFSYDELFYLMSRGICKRDAEMLLTKGFIMKNINYHKDELLEMVDKYWG